MSIRRVYEYDSYLEKLFDGLPDTWHWIQRLARNSSVGGTEIHPLHWKSGLIRAPAPDLLFSVGENY